VTPLTQLTPCVSEQARPQAGGQPWRTRTSGRPRSGRLARLVTLKNPTLLPFLFPDGPGWPDDQTAMGADWDLWGVNGEPEREPSPSDGEAHQ
jgi:hypothetical protein